MDRKGNAEAGQRIHREQEAHVSYAIGSGAASALRDNHSTGTTPVSVVVVMKRQMRRAATWLVCTAAARPFDCSLSCLHARCSCCVL
jgi:hypothetical protein